MCLTCECVGVGHVKLCHVYCATCFLTCECVGVGHAKTVDGDGEGQVRSSCMMDRER